MRLKRLFWMNMNYGSTMTTLFYSLPSIWWKQMGTSLILSWCVLMYYDSRAFCSVTFNAACVSFNEVCRAHSLWLTAGTSMKLVKWPAARRRTILGRCYLGYLAVRRQSLSSLQCLHFSRLTSPCCLWDEPVSFMNSAKETDVLLLQAGDNNRLKKVWNINWSCGWLRRPPPILL